MSTVRARHTACGLKGRWRVKPMSISGSHTAPDLLHPVSLLRPRRELLSLPCSRQMRISSRHSTGTHRRRPGSGLTPRNSDSRSTSPLCRDTAGAERVLTAAGAGTGPGLIGLGREGKEREGKERRLHIQFNPELFSRYIQWRFTVLNLKCCSMQETRKAPRSIFMISSRFRVKFSHFVSLREGGEKKVGAALPADCRWGLEQPPLSTLLGRPHSEAAAEETLPSPTSAPDSCPPPAPSSAAPLGKQKSKPQENLCERVSEPRSAVRERPAA